MIPSLTRCFLSTWLHAKNLEDAPGLRATLFPYDRLWALRIPGLLLVTTATGLLGFVGLVLADVIR